MRTSRLLVLYLAVIFSQSACDMNQSLSESNDEIEKRTKQFAEEYYALRKDAHFGEAMALYSDGFYEVTNREYWLEYLLAVNRDLGSITSIHFRQLKGISTVMSFSKGGTYCEIEYFVFRTGGRTLETLLVYMPTIDKEQRIIGHVVELQGFAVANPTSNNVIFMKKPMVGGIMDVNRYTRRKD